MGVSGDDPDQVRSFNARLAFAHPGRGGPVGRDPVARDRCGANQRTLVARTRPANGSGGQPATDVVPDHALSPADQRLAEARRLLVDLGALDHEATVPSGGALFFHTPCDHHRELHFGLGSEPDLDPAMAPHLRPAMAPAIEPGSEPGSEPDLVPAMEPDLDPAIGPDLGPDDVPRLRRD